MKLRTRLTSLIVLACLVPLVLTGFVATRIADRLVLRQTRTAYERQARNLAEFPFMAQASPPTVMKSTPESARSTNNLAYAFSILPFAKRQVQVYGQLPKLLNHAHELS